MTALASLRPADWTLQAACPTSGLPLTAWDDHGTPDARQVCANCPVRLDCAHHALDTAERTGLWGGLDVDDRKRLAPLYGYERPGLPAHGNRSRYNHRTDPCRPDRTGRACPAPISCREAHRRWAAERRAAGAWTRTTQPESVAS